MVTAMASTWLQTARCRGQGTGRCMHREAKTGTYFGIRAAMGGALE